MLSMPRQNFVAIPIPDTISGCITGGKNIKTVKTYYIVAKYVSSNTMLWIIECQLPKLIQDGYCDDSTNNRHCTFDGGDCCGPCVNKEHCSECKCKTGFVKEIRNALVGDGFCHDSYNSMECNFDGGDCCGSCVNTKYCNECNCSGEHSGDSNDNAFLANGFCEDTNNNEDCNYDGFDCCGLYVNKKYCETCKCQGI